MRFLALIGRSFWKINVPHKVRHGAKRKDGQGLVQ